MPKLTHKTKGTAEGRLLVESKRKSPVPYNFIKTGDVTRLILDARTTAPIKKKHENLALKLKCNYDIGMSIYISDTYSTITYNGTSITLDELTTKESCVATFNIGIYLFTFGDGSKSLKVIVIKFDTVSTIVKAKSPTAPSAPALESIINSIDESYANELFDMPLPANPQPTQILPALPANPRPTQIPIIWQAVPRESVPRESAPISSVIPVARPATRVRANKKPVKVKTLKHSETLPPAHFLNLIPEENRVCSICTDTITADPYLTKCYHLFHKTCIEQWFTTKGNATTCPVCRVG